MINEPAQNMLDKTFKDPITELLLKHSNITKIQFETFVIDILTENISDKSLSFKEKTLFRTRNVSRGSFSRSLQQARKNIISSIFTIILLNYIGIFESQPFEEYQILAEKLKDYIDIIESAGPSASKILLNRIEKELLEGIEKLTKPTTLKNP